MKRMTCNVSTYKGEEGYAFISYCHKDGKRVFPILECLGREGYRVWYDAGIEAGSDWTEMIADRLVHADACVAFFSRESMESHHCRREVNLAILRDIPFIAVFLEEVEMTPGMEMQLATVQAVMAHEATDSMAAAAKLQGSKALDSCKGLPEPSVVVQDWSGWEPEHRQPEHDRGNGIQELLLREETAGAGIGQAQQAKKALRVTKVIPPKRIYFIRERTGEQAEIKDGNFSIGSSEDADFVIRDNPYIGGIHVRFMVFPRPGRAIIYDEHSTNGTFVNDDFLPSGGRHELKDGDMIQLADEKFLFHIEDQGKGGAA